MSHGVMLATNTHALSATCMYIGPIPLTDINLHIIFVPVVMENFPLGSRTVMAVYEPFFLKKIEIYFCVIHFLLSVTQLKFRERIVASINKHHK